jgi:hypothetical protein
MADEAEQVLTIAVDGERYTMDDLTFRERREVRRLARDLDGNPDVDFDDVMIDDLIAAFVTVCKQRGTPAFTVEDALDMKPGELLAAAEDPPTKGAAKAGAKPKTS